MNNGSFQDYHETGMGYDLDGSLTALSRSRPGLTIDALEYRYEGNRMHRLEDNSGQSEGFVNGANEDHELDYDGMGNLVKDGNRGIRAGSLQYNSLGLVRQVNQGGQELRYVYSGDGAKLGLVQYLNGSLFEISHEEGRYSLAGGYEWQHRDHLGNVRVSFTGAGGVATASQYQGYDPWGLELSGLSSGGSTNRVRYNGKESLTELGGGLLDYGARLYDATIGRWGVVDPLADVQESWSGYHYGFNNPINNIDPFGLEGSSAIADCPTCPKTPEYDKYRDNKSLFTYDNKTGIVLNGNGNGPTVYGQFNLNVTPGTQVMQPISGFLGWADQLLNGDRRYWDGHQVNSDGVLTNSIKPITGTPPDIGVGGIKTLITAEKAIVEGATTVLGHYPEYVQLAEKLVAKRFQIPTNIWDKMSSVEQWTANTKFLDRMILRGDNIRLATTLDQVRPGSFYQQELNYLFGKGYKVSSDGLWLVK